MKLAICFSTKDRSKLSQMTLQRLAGRKLDAYWLDGSTSKEGKKFFETPNRVDWHFKKRVTGGPDAAILAALTYMLESEENYTHVGILENDVLLGHNWFNDCLDLFACGRTEGLPIGAVSARSYKDRVLFQRDGYAVLHNAGAGNLILTREAAYLLRNNYRTGWALENREIFAQICGVDIGKFWAFSGNAQVLTADWWFDTCLAAHGLATVAPTPCNVDMVGQDTPLAEQGLELVRKPLSENPFASQFDLFAQRLQRIQDRTFQVAPIDWRYLTGGSMTVFPHHLHRLGGAYLGNWSFTWNQGFGPFVYRAGAGGASLSVPIFGSCSFLVTGGRVDVADGLSGFTTGLDAPSSGQMIAIHVPAGMLYRDVTAHFGEGACFCGIETAMMQPDDPSQKFDWHMLPPPFVPNSGATSPQVAE